MMRVLFLIGPSSVFSSNREYPTRNRPNGRSTMRLILDLRAARISAIKRPFIGLYGVNWRTEPF